MPKKELAPVTRDATIHVHKKVYGKQFRKRTPAAIKAIREFVRHHMKTQDVRLDVKLNKFVWSQGVKHPVHRVRVRMTRKRNDDEDAKHKMFTYVTWIPTTDFHFLNNETVKE